MNSCRIYTPAPLAHAMTGALGHAPSLSWLEPSFGRGAFLREISALGVASNKITCIDLDGRKAENDRLGKVFRGREFLSWSLTCMARFDRIVGNPPFIAIERLRDPLRRLASDTRWGSIEAVGLNGNLWASFLIASLRLLKPQGHLSFILPAAWGYADYAVELRSKLPTYFREFVCHRSEEPLFPTVQDGCYVLQCFGFGEPNKITSSHIYRQAVELNKGLRPPVRPSPPSIKTRSCSPTENVVTARNLFQVRLGAVTGDAGYFLLSEARRLELGLPLTSLLPVVTRSRHLMSSSIRREDWEAIRDSGDRAFLFYPNVNSLKHYAVQRYLNLPKASGGCNKLAGWVKKRNPWYSVVLPREFHGFMSGVSFIGPWIALNSMRSLVATNTLYVIRFNSSIKSVDARAACALSLVTSFARSQVGSKIRTYAGGMKKLEPSDVMALSLPIKKNVLGAATVYETVAKQLTAGGEKAAMSTADDWYASR